jgi:hypothetical protein
MKLGTRATLEAMARKSVVVDVPEADASFRLREMSGTERDTLEVGSFSVSEDGKRILDRRYLRARLVALCLVGEDNVRLYADEEVHQLSDNLPASVIDKLFAEAQTLNALGGVDVDDALKNSASVPADASSSDSP